MDASAASAPGGWRVPRYFSLVALARLVRAAAAHTVMGDFCARRDARRHRLVDGGLGPLRADQGLTILAGIPSDARLLDLYRGSVDGGGPGSARSHHRAEAHSGRRLGGSCTGTGSDLSRRPGVWASRLPHLQYLPPPPWAPLPRLGPPRLHRS